MRSLIILVILLLAGCIIPYSSSELAQYGKVETYADDNAENLAMPQNRLKSLMIERRKNIANLTNEQFKQCAEANFAHRTLLLKDSRNNGYKYNYRQGPTDHLITKDYEIKPAVMQQTSETKVIKQNADSIIILARSSYKAAFEQRFMAYFVTAQNLGSKRQYKFENIRRGQFDSGNQPNMGATTRVVLTKGEDGITALNALKNEVDQIEQCLTKKR